MPPLVSRLAVRRAIARPVRRAYAVHATQSALRSKPPKDGAETVHDMAESESLLDSMILGALSRLGSSCMPFSRLAEQYVRNSGKVLDAFLPYEPTPTPSRRINFDQYHDAIVVVAHIAVDGSEREISLSSGFAIDVPEHGGSVIVSCAHTLEEVITSEPSKFAHAVQPTSMIMSNICRCGVGRPIHHLRPSLPPSS